MSIVTAWEATHWRREDDASQARRIDAERSNATLVLATLTGQRAPAGRDFPAGLGPSSSPPPALWRPTARSHDRPHASERPTGLQGSQADAPASPPPSLTLAWPTRSSTLCVAATPCPSERHRVAASGHADPPKTTSHPERPWRNDPPTSWGHANSLTLQIPQTQTSYDPSRARLAGSAPSQEQVYHSNPYHEHAQQQSQNVRSGTPSQALPPFASLHERPARPDVVNLVERPQYACTSCSSLRPSLQDIAVAVTEVDEYVATLCGRERSRLLENLDYSLVQITQMVIKQLRHIKLDLQQFRETPAIHGHVHAGGSTSAPTMSPPGHKRAASQWEREDFTKRPRSKEPVDVPFQPVNSLTLREDRSTPSEYDVTSYYGKPGSPSLSNKPARALPSPATSAYPPSAAPTSVQSLDSPTATHLTNFSNQFSVESSATSTHIADLHRQISLRALEHQTLQSEYASLLQKFQREKIKSQAVEQKTAGYGQEMSELTNRYDELMDQFRTTELELEESERRRETDRADASRDKEQWGRMLEMSGKLHAKGAEERQRLIEEKTDLAQRLAMLEGGEPHSSEQVSAGSSLHAETSSSRPGVARETLWRGGFEDTAVLRREVYRLDSRVQTLTAALQQVQRSTHDLDGKAHSLLQQSASVRSIIDDAILNGSGQSATSKMLAEAALSTSNRSLAGTSSATGNVSATNITKPVANADMATPGEQAHGATTVVSLDSSRVAGSSPASSGASEASPLASAGMHP